MKISVCFFALAIAYACAAWCTQTSDCDPAMTSCGLDTALTCSDRQCVCNSEGVIDTDKCAANADCHNHGFFHQCFHGHWVCRNGNCHCSTGQGK
ncbi:hypothetical protein DPMN_181516 [Dreissena polymorpha]|uniref:Uncharacterized protein n=1 Tax=Dreissena polymorpha TaxID=45954 RepID=A0A9D4DGD6_DREPO|nr:hypothetical protein DPMN_181516 [Dreissena polymorpha]